MGTAVASTSGTSIDFTGIPSWAKRITVMFSGVSTNGTSQWLIRLGTSSGFVATGYSSGGTTSTSYISSTVGLLSNINVSAAETYNGIATITNINGNDWVSATVVAGATANNSSQTTGRISLSSALDRLRITTVNGTDTFDAGSINVMWEG
jgi:hypothetical protein